MAGSVFGVTLPDGALASKGVGGASGPISSVLTVNTTTDGTGADTNETTLWTYTLPANTLSADGKGVRIYVSYAWGATGNNKTAKLYFGATVIASLGLNAANGVKLECMATVLRTGANAQVACGRDVYASGQLITQSTPAADTTGVIVIKFTGQNAVAAANDIVFNFVTVEALD